MTAQVIPFPGRGSIVVQEVAVAPTTAITEAEAKDPLAFPKVTKIRRWGRMRRAYHPNDQDTIMFARLARSWAEKAHALAQTEPDSEAHRLALHMVGIDHKLPRNNLRCIVSTLDEEKDFDLRCAELKIFRAEYELECWRIGRLRVLETAPWWESPTLKPLVNANNHQWSRYQDRVLDLAETPARTYHQLGRKRDIIGKTWLQAKGAWYDRLRSAVAADEAWLAEHRPKRRRAAR